MRVFRSVVDMGGFSRAARRLHLSQSAISLQVKHLEEEFGFEFLERRGRGGSRLTPEGQVAYAHFIQILDLAESLRGNLEVVRRGASGVLCVGATLTAHVYLLPAVVSDFQRRHPHVQVGLRGGYVSEVLEALDRRQIDLGIVWAPVDTAAFEPTPLMQDELVAVVPPRHPFADRGSVASGELEHHPVVLNAVHSATRTFVTDRLRAAGVVLRRPVEVGTPAAIKEAVLAGLGVGFLSPHAVRREVLAGQLSVVRLQGVDLRRQLVLVRLRGDDATPAELRLQAHLVRSLRALQRPLQTEPAAVRRAATALSTPP